MSKYFLGSHVFVRILDGGAFFLDVRRDEYLCVPNCGALAENVSGWPASVRVSSSEGGDNTVSQLCAKGLLSTRGKTAEPAELQTATHDWFDEWRVVTPATAARYIVPFVRAVVRTTLAWWLFSLEHNIRTLERRARRQRARARVTNADDIRRLTGVFLRLRVCAYTANERCLFDSMVMSNFLNRCGCYPTFVMGIRTGPFKAHCWTQFEDCALNELDTRTRRYTAILAI